MKNKGFTLAEIIIAMTIIGVIAAITIPALLVSTNEKTLEAQKKALHARVSQAMSQIDDLRVYKKNSGNADKSSALNFITKGLSKTYRITKVCDKNSLTKNCDFPNEFTTANGTIFKISENQALSTYVDSSQTTFAIDTEIAGFKTANGESIVVYYNPNCYGKKTNGFYSGNAASAMCLNMIYDLNGKDSAPNEIGKDIGFITVFFPKDPDIVLPNIYGADVTNSFSDYATAIEACKKQDSNLILPNWQDGMAMAINKKLSNVSNSSYLVTSAGSAGIYKIDVESLIPSITDKFSGLQLRCVYNK